MPEQKIEEAVSKDALRYPLTGVHLNVKRKRLEASNGKIAALVPVEDIGEHEVIIPVDAVKASRKKFCNGALEITEEMATVVRTGNAFKVIDAQYPDLDAVAPEIPDKAPTISIDADLLVKLAKALCTGKGAKKGNKISLWVTGKSKAVIVAPYYQNGARGVIMPLEPKLAEGGKK